MSLSIQPVEVINDFAPVIAKVWYLPDENPDKEGGYYFTIELDREEIDESKQLYRRKENAARNARRAAEVKHHQLAGGEQ